MFRSKPSVAGAARPLAGLFGLALAIVAGTGAALAAADVPLGPNNQVPGTRIDIDPHKLPEPYATQAVANAPSGVPRPDGATLTVPEGFHVNLFATDMEDARWMTVAENGDVLLAEPGQGRIMLLRDSDGDGEADKVTEFVGGLDQPHGLAIHGGYLYIGSPERIWRVPYKPGDTKAAGRPEPVTKPGALGDGSGHWTRNIAFAPDGKHFYVAIGSQGNIAVEPVPRATVQQFDIDGSNRTTFASGLRNPVGIEFYPGTDDLFVVVNERDGLGDGLVPDYLTHLQKGGFYGWPYSYIGSHPQPGFAKKRPDLVKQAIVPDLLFEAHSAPLGLAFYTADQFPEKYRGGAFVGLHGSWNAGDPRGYFVAFVPFKDNRPADYYEVFASGFWTRGKDPARVFGRPVGVVVAKDGSLLVADDLGNAVWRISYGKK